MNSKLQLGVVVGLAWALVALWRSQRAVRTGSSAEYEAIHDAVRLDPETVWPRVRALLGTSRRGRDANYENQDLIEDLMFWHADAFIDRFEALVAESPHLEDDIAIAHVGGVAVGPGLERFYALQDRISDRLEAEGKLTRWTGVMPLTDTPTGGSGRDSPRGR